MVKLGLVGIGAWGQKIATTLDAMPGVKVTAAVVRPSNKPVNGRLYDAIIYESAEEMLTTAKLDGVVITTPASTHARLLSLAFEHELPAFVEKPVVTNIDDAMELDARWAAAAQPILLVDHVQLFNPSLVDMRKLVERHGGAIEIRGSHHNWGPFRSDCSALWDYGSHDIAIAMMLEDFPDNTQVTGVDNPCGIPGPMGGIAETTMIQLAVGNAIARLLIGNGLPEKSRRYTVRCTDGVIVEYDEASTPKLRLMDHGIITGVSSGNTTPLSAALGTFVDAVKAGKAPNEDHRFGMGLPMEVVRVLQECDEHLLTDGVERKQMQGRTL